MKSILVKFLFPLLILAFSCAKDTQSGNPVPYVAVNVTIDTDNPLYIDLQREGGFVYLDNVGNKGIVVIHDFSDNFWAFDRTCTYHITSPCGKVMMATSGLNLVCGTYSGKTLDACCASTYSLSGTVTHGPATYDLRHYNISANGNVITITN